MTTKNSKLKFRVITKNLIQPSNVATASNLVTWRENVPMIANCSAAFCAARTTMIHSSAQRSFALSVIKLDTKPQSVTRKMWRLAISAAKLDMDIKGV